MKFKKEAFRKLKKDDLVKIILQLQEKDSTLYEKTQEKDLKIIENPSVRGGNRITLILKPQDIVEIWSEYITKSGYPQKDTKYLIEEIDLKQLDNYEKIKNNGWNRKVLKLIENN